MYLSIVCAKKPTQPKWGVKPHEALPMIESYTKIHYAKVEQKKHRKQRRRRTWHKHRAAPDANAAKVIRPWPVPEELTERLKWADIETISLHPKDQGT